MADIPRPVRVLVLGASLRKESFNVRLAALAARTASAHGAVVTTVDYGGLAVPPLDTDLLETDGVPEGARRFGDLLTENDGFVLAAPEYNHSVSGVLKNLIDWTSRIRPWPFIGRHGLLLSASTGPVGGLRGLWALRVPLEGLGTHVYPDMFGLADAGTALTAGDDLADPALASRLTGLVLFLSLLPQFIPPGADPLGRSLVLSLIVVGCALVWFPAVALVVHSIGALLGGRRVQRVLTVATSLLLLGLGLRMLLFR